MRDEQQEEVRSLTPQERAAVETWFITRWYEVLVGTPMPLDPTVDTPSEMGRQQVFIRPSRWADHARDAAYEALRLRVEWPRYLTPYFPTAGIMEGGFSPAEMTPEQVYEDVVQEAKAYYVWVFDPWTVHVASDWGLLSRMFYDLSDLGMGGNFDPELDAPAGLKHLVNVAPEKAGDWTDLVVEP
jgi:hypothetical protein